MNEFLRQLWSFQLDLVPVTIALAVFEFSSLARRYFRWAYMPIYFMFFPMGHADKLYAEYVSEDDFYCIGTSMNSEEKMLLRNKIVATSFWSMLFSIIFNPLAAGVFCAAFLNEEQFWQFTALLIIFKFVLLCSSLFNLKNVSFIDKNGSFGGVVIMYIFYLAVIWRIKIVSFEWANARLSVGGLYELAISSVDFIIFNIGIYGLLMAALGAAVSYWTTNPQVIPENNS